MVLNPSIGFEVFNDVFHHSSEDKYSGPRRSASKAIRFTMDAASVTGPLSSLLHPKKTGITDTVPDAAKRTARSGSTVDGEERKS